MARPHSLLKFKKAQFVLAKVLAELKSCELSDENYRLDLAFDRELHDLLERYGYDAHRAIALINRHEAIEDSLRMSPDGTLAQIYSETLRKRGTTPEEKCKGFVD
jgi:hypothetical protein